MKMIEEELMTTTEEMRWVTEERDKLIKISEKMESLREIVKNPTGYENVNEFMSKLNEESKKIEKEITDPCMRKYAHIISVMHVIPHEEFLKHLSSPKDLTAYTMKYWDPATKTISIKALLQKSFDMIQIK